MDGYRLIGRIGRGGMGVVYQAEQRATGQTVAIKFCKLNGSPFDVADSHLLRFEREIQFAAKLNHPNIGRVFGAGEANGVPYFVMEYVSGRNLADYFQQRRLDQSQIVALICEVCGAVQHAHQNGIIHRDLKPRNILITPDGRPKVLDFGLAKALKPEPGEEWGLSVTGEKLGTPLYMAPEQIAGGHVDTRTDIYALGVILYEALCGHHPHDTSGSLRDFEDRVCNEDPRRPREMRADLDGELEMLLLKILQRDPDLRYPSAGELAEDLQHWLRHEPVAAGRTYTRYVLRKWYERHRAAAIIAAAVLALATNEMVLYVAIIQTERRRAVALLENMRGTAQSLLQRANDSARAGRIDEALETVGLAVALDPENAEQLQHAARLAQRAGRFGEAMGYYQKVLRLRGDLEAQRGLEECAERLRMPRVGGDSAREMQPEILSAESGSVLKPDVQDKPSSDVR